MDLSFNLRGLIGEFVVCFHSIFSFSSLACSNIPVVIQLASHVEITTNFYAPILLCTSIPGGTDSPHLLKMNSPKEHLDKYLHISENAKTSEKMKELYASEYGPLSSSDREVIKNPCTWIEFKPRELNYKMFYTHFPATLSFQDGAKNYQVKIIINPESVKTKGKCKIRPEIKLVY